jgi:hypothetical protein
VPVCSACQTVNSSCECQDPNTTCTVEGEYYSYDSCGCVCPEGQDCPPVDPCDGQPPEGMELSCSLDYCGAGVSCFAGTWFCDGGHPRGPCQDNCLPGTCAIFAENCDDGPCACSADACGEEVCPGGTPTCSGMNCEMNDPNDPCGCISECFSWQSCENGGCVDN